MGKVKNGLKYEDVITRHQPSVMEGDNVNSVDHGKSIPSRLIFHNKL